MVNMVNLESVPEVITMKKDDHYFDIEEWIVEGGLVQKLS